MTDQEIRIQIGQLNNLRWKLVDKNQVSKVLEIDKKIEALKKLIKES